jgi:NADP-reducing hydrogenase subunit HndB
MDAFLEASGARNLTNVIFKQTGCMGLCSVEPTVEVKVPGMPDTIYGNVDAETAREIVREHLVRGRMVNNHIFDRPAGDILKNK